MPSKVFMRTKIDEFERNIQAFIRRNEQATDRIVLKVASNVLASIQEGWPVDTGVSRAAWRGPVRIASARYRLSNPVRYAPVIEYGGYPGIGPKTERIGPVTFPGGLRVGSGIYPTQRPHAPVRRALSRHRRDIRNEIQQEMDRTWGRR